MITFNLITGINKSKTSKKHVSHEYKCKLVANVTQIKSEIMINVGASAKIQKNIMHIKKDFIWNPPTCTCQIVDMQQVLLTIL